MLLANRHALLSCYTLLTATQSKSGGTTSSSSSGGSSGNNASAAAWMKTTATETALSTIRSSSSSSSPSPSLSSNSAGGGSGMMRCMRIFKHALLNLDQFKYPVSLIKIYSANEGLFRSVSVGLSSSPHQEEEAGSSVDCFEESDVILYNSNKRSLSYMWKQHVDRISDLSPNLDHVCGLRHDGTMVDKFMQNSVCEWKDASSSSSPDTTTIRPCARADCIAPKSKCYNSSFCTSIHMTQLRWRLCTEEHICDPSIQRSKVELALRNESYLTILQGKYYNFTEHLFL